MNTVSSQNLNAAASKAVSSAGKGLKSGVRSAAGCCGSACGGFRDFITRGNVVDLAVAVVIGQAFTDLVNSFVVAFVTPLIGLFGPVNDAGNLAFTINGSTFQYGLFINGLISFIMICLLVYFAIVLPLNAMLQRLYPLTECPECLSDDIPIAAKRCKHCCSPLEPIVIVKKGRSARKIDDTAEDEVVTAVPGSGGGGGAEGGLGERTSMVPSEDFYDPEEDVVLTYQYQQPQPQMQQQ